MVNTSSSKTQRSMIGIIGAIAFFAGMLLAIIGGGVSRDNGTIVLILVIMGIIIGLFNITGREMIPFLVAAIALVVVGSAVQTIQSPGRRYRRTGQSSERNGGLYSCSYDPAAIINAVRVVWSLAQPGD